MESKFSKAFAEKGLLHTTVDMMQQRVKTTFCYIFHRFRLILLTVLLELWLQVLLSSTEMVEVPIIGRKSQRIVSRVTRGLRLHKRQLGRFTQHIKPAKEIDPIPEGPKVLMPRISPEEMKKFIDQAAEAVRFRMESTETSIYRSGMYFFYLIFKCIFF